MKNITESELKMLDSCQSATDWSKACSTIKASRNGEYPEDWWKKVKQSGLMDKILARWGAGSDLTIAPFKFKTDGKHRE